MRLFNPCQPVCSKSLDTFLVFFICCNAECRHHDPQPTILLMTPQQCSDASSISQRHSMKMQIILDRVVLIHDEAHPLRQRRHQALTKQCAAPFNRRSAVSTHALNMHARWRSRHILHTWGEGGPGAVELKAHIMTHCVRCGLGA